MLSDGCLIVETHTLPCDSRPWQRFPLTMTTECRERSLLPLPLSLLSLPLITLQPWRKSKALKSLSTNTSRNGFLRRKERSVERKSKMIYRGTSIDALLLDDDNFVWLLVSFSGRITAILLTLYTRRKGVRRR
nr:uncharacterized protein LOC117161897 [Bombus vancouverensis nearcticus]